MTHSTCQDIPPSETLRRHHREISHLFRPVFAKTIPTPHNQPFFKHTLAHVCALAPPYSLQDSNMHLMYTVDATGKRLYMLKKVSAGEVTKSAHPARFSPDDKYSR